MNLQEWTTAYLKYKDVIKRRISDIKVEENRVLVKNKDGSEHPYLCVADLDKLKPEDFEKNKVVCLNKKKNVLWVIDNWDSLSKIDTVIIFVNVSKSESWSLHPKNHNNISEDDNIKQGLLSLFQSVPGV